MKIEPDQLWETRDGVAGRAPRRTVVVLSVQPGKHNLDRGSSQRPPDDEIVFRFVSEGRTSRCGESAFRSTYLLIR